MIKKFILPVAILLAANYLIKKYLLAKNVTFSIKKINFNNNILQPKLILTISAYNPINATVKISDLISDIFVNNKKVGVATTDIGFTVDAKKTTNFDLFVSILPVQAITSIFDIFKKFGGEIKMSGSVVVDGVTFPIQTTYNI